MTIFYVSARNVEGILQALPGAGRIAHSAELPALGDLRFDHFWQFVII